MKDEKFSHTEMSIISDTAQLAYCNLEKRYHYTFCITLPNDDQFPKFFY